MKPTDNLGKNCIIYKRHVFILKLCSESFDRRNNYVSFFFSFNLIRPSRCPTNRRYPWREGGPAFSLRSGLWEGIFLHTTRWSVWPRTKLLDGVWPERPRKSRRLTATATAPELIVSSKSPVVAPGRPSQQVPTVVDSTWWCLDVSRSSSTCSKTSVYRFKTPIYCSRCHHKRIARTTVVYPYAE